MKETFFIVALYVIIAPLFMLLMSFLFKLNFIIMLTSFIIFRIIWYVFEKILGKPL